MTLLAPNDNPYSPELTGYQFSRDHHRFGDYPPELYRKLLDAIPDEADEVTQFGFLPPDHFVWSDELASAFPAVIDAYYTREDATFARMGLRWEPALRNLEQLIRECCDLSEVQPAGSPHAAGRQSRKKKTEAQYRLWHDMQERIEDQHPHWSVSQVAGQIERELPEDRKRHRDTIRKHLKKRKLSKMTSPNES